jgi:hypothetical protein
MVGRDSGEPDISEPPVAHHPLFAAQEKADEPSRLTGVTSSSASSALNAALKSSLATLCQLPPASDHSRTEETD